MTLYTTRRHVAFQIDDDDHDAVSKHSWHIDTQGYPRGYVPTERGRRMIRLHLFLLGRAAGPSMGSREPRQAR